MGGISGYGNTYRRLYNAAFQAGILKKFGTHYTGDISINESVSALEMSIFAAGHEAAHLMISNANEEMADWYGIYALKEYRKDNGNKCKK